MARLDTQSAAPSQTLVGAERTDRINFLQDRIAKLNKLKAKYQAEANTLSQSRVLHCVFDSNLFIY